MLKNTKNFALYQWQGVNRYGEKIQGEQVITQLKSLKIELRQQGIILLKARKKHQLPFLFATITQRDITLFSRQMATMLIAGIPFIQSIEIIIRGQKNLKFISILLQIKNDIERGEAIAAALKKFPRYFNELYCNLIAAGEISGSLDIIFDRIATYQEKSQQLTGKIKKALYYPLAVLFIAIAITALLLIYIVPQFQKLFSSFGSSLPFFTQIIIELSEWLTRYGYELLFFILLSGFMLRFAIQRWVIFAFALDQFILKLPIVGKILKNAIIARFIRTLATTFAAGLPLLDSLTAAACAAGNRVYIHALLKSREKIAIGQTLQLSFQETRLFPELALQMVRIGEESGSLDKMLYKTAEWFENSVEQTVDNLSSLLEPFVMIILGILIGGLVIAMYLPIFKLGSVV